MLIPYGQKSSRVRVSAKIRHRGEFEENIQLQENNISHLLAFLHGIQNKLSD